MDKLFIAKGVAGRLFATENAVDAAITEASQLLGEMVTARQTLNLGANVGNGAATKLAAAIASLSEARTAVVEAHEELAVVQGRMGIRTRMGPVDKQTPDTTNGEYRRAG